ncbi:TPA: thermonuclease family protein [Photobacterium damselae]
MKKFLLLIFFSSQCYSLPVSIELKPSAITSVYDGDTFRANISQLDTSKSIRVRVRHIDTPEIKGKCSYEKQKAIEAREFAKYLLLNSNSITLTNLGYDRYKRLLATITLDNKYSFDQTMIYKNLARPYNGGKRLSWCQSY